MTDEEKRFVDNPESNEGQPELTDDATEESWTVVAGSEKDTQEQEVVAQEQEAVTEETKSKDDKSKEYWQSERDKLLAAVKAHDPQFADSYLARRRQERKSEPAATVEDVAKGKVADTGDDQEFATRADIQRLIGEVKFEIAQERERNEQARIQEQYEAEYDKVDQALINFCREHNISQDEHKHLTAEALSFGANVSQLGGPSALLRAYARVATDYLRERQGTNTIKARASEAEQKAMAAKLTMQPSGSPVDVQAKRKLTKEEELLDQMHAVGRSSAAEELFGK